MGFFRQILAYRRLGFLLLGLIFLQILLVVLGLYLVVRFLLLWAFPLVFTLPLTFVALRWTIGRLKKFYSARNDYMPPGMTALGPPSASTKEKLSNVAEEIAIATGNDEPRVAVCKSSGINAFFAYPEEPGIRATTVVFTSAMVKHLSRQELQAVVAHLYAHRANFDRMFFAMAAAMYLTVFVVADLFMVLNAVIFFYGGDALNYGQLSVLVTLATMFGPILAAAEVQYYMMRRMRLLDDLTSIQTTNDPDCLIGALEKTASVPDRLEISYDVSTAHFFFDAVTDAKRTLPWQKLATHPTPAARIAAVQKATATTPGRAAKVQEEAEEQDNKEEPAPEQPGASA